MDKDCANNVAAVGHSHPRVVKAGQNALAKIQTNGRFLNPVQQRYVAKLLSTFPSELNTVYFVNSGSEANDLALRIARSHTTAVKPQDVIVMGSAYHGHTQEIMVMYKSMLHSTYIFSERLMIKGYFPIQVDSS